MHPERARLLQLKYVLSDVLVLAAAFFIAYEAQAAWRVEPYPLQSYLWVLWVAAPGVPVLFGLLNRYRLDGLSEEESAFRSTAIVSLQGVALAYGFFSILVFSLDITRVSPSFLISVFGAAFPFLVLTRTSLWPALLRREQMEPRRVLITGSVDKALELASLLSRTPRMGTRLVGFMTFEPGQADSLRGLPVLGDLDEAESILSRHRVDEVLIAVPQDRLAIVDPLLLLCQMQGVTARLACDFLPRGKAKPYLEQLGGVPILTFAVTSKNADLLALKRVMDVVLGSALLALSLPLLALAALSVKLTSRGPVLYRQVRCGLDGRTFVFLKFRTMIEGADEKRSEIAHLNEAEAPIFKISADPRVTPVGRILRRTSVDELPQLLNVLRGDMSLVGPRPPLPEEVQQYDGWQRRRLSMKPGITCLWQVSGRSALGFKRWVELDLDYIDNWSLWVDLKIMLRTAVAVVSLKGAW